MCDYVVQKKGEPMAALPDDESPTRGSITDRQSANPSSAPTLKLTKAFTAVGPINGCFARRASLLMNRKRGVDLN